LDEARHPYKGGKMQNTEIIACIRCSAADISKKSRGRSKVRVQEQLPAQYGFCLLEDGFSRNDDQGEGRENEGRRGN